MMATRLVAAIALHLVDRQAEMSAGGITVADILEKLEAGTAALEAREAAIAPIEHKATPARFIPHLWGALRLTDCSRPGRRRMIRRAAGARSTTPRPARQGSSGIFQ